MADASTATTDAMAAAVTADANASGVNLMQRAKSFDLALELYSSFPTALPLPAEPLPASQASSAGDAPTAAAAKDALAAMWDTKEHSDVMLLVQDSVIKAHKRVLTAASAFFRAMFSGDFAEADQREVPLHAVTPEGTELVLKAVYTGTVRLSDSNILTALDTADKLEIQEILDACELYLTDEIYAHNVFQLLQLSEKYTLPGLNAEIETFVVENFKICTEHSMFQDISKEALILFISNDELDLRELDIFNGVMAWCGKHPSDEKKAALCDVMKHVRLSFMTSAEITEHVLGNPAVRESEACARLAEAVLERVRGYEAVPHRRPLLEAQSPERPRGRLCATVVLPQIEDYTNKELRQPAREQVRGAGPHRKLHEAQHLWDGGGGDKVLQNRGVLTHSCLFHSYFRGQVHLPAPCFTECLA